MFGLSRFFAAIARLADAANRLADTFDEAEAEIRGKRPEPVPLPEPGVEPARNGRRKVTAGSGT